MTDDPDIVERLEDYAEDDSYTRKDGTRGYTNRAEAMRKAVAEITRRRAEAEALRKDAERYQWLRDPNNGKALLIMRTYGLDDAKELDVAIDAAIAATKEQQA